MSTVIDGKLVEIKFCEATGRKEGFVDGRIVDRFRLLACACDADTEKEAEETMSLASEIFHPFDDSMFNIMYDVAWHYIIHKFSRSEFYYQSKFDENYSKIRNGKITRVKSDGYNIPDSWVLKDDELIPVEVKKNSFDAKALKQLERYIKVYGCKYGIAVGSQLTTELPNNIEFIPISEIDF